MLLAPASCLWREARRPEACALGALTERKSQGAADSKSTDYVVFCMHAVGTEKLDVKFQCAHQWPLGLLGAMGAINASARETQCRRQLGTACVISGETPAVLIPGPALMRDLRHAELKIQKLIMMTAEAGMRSMHLPNLDMTPL